jgi:glycine C-acetyltransferase
MADLERQLQQAKADGTRTILITTDGVFSMDGFVAPLDRITALARDYGALVHIDECHATGFLGATGRGSAEVRGVMDRIDIFTGTLGKAMGGALGGFTTARARSDRNAASALASVSVLQLAAAARRRGRHQGLRHAGDRRRSARAPVRQHALFPRKNDGAAGFDLKPGVHPICPVMLYDAPLAQRFAERNCSKKASTRSASSSRSCPRARRASARR